MNTLSKITTIHCKTVREYSGNSIREIFHNSQNNETLSVIPFYTTKLSSLHKDSSLQYREFTHKVFQDSDVLNTAWQKLDITELTPYNNADFASTDEYSSLRQTGETIILRLADEKPAKKILLSLLKKAPYIYYHSIEVMCLTMAMAQCIGYDAESIYDAGMAAVLHDIGKVLLPCELVRLTQEWTDIQKKKIEMIPVFSAAMAKKSSLCNPDIHNALLAHQENFIGTGYPFAKMHREIHPYGMLVHVADDYDTTLLLQKKPEYARQYIRKMAYRRYSLTAVNSFNSLFQ